MGWASAPWDVLEVESPLEETRSGKALSHPVGIA